MSAPAGPATRDLSPIALQQYRRNLAVEQMYVDAFPTLSIADASAMEDLILSLPRRLRSISESPVRAQEVCQAVRRQLDAPAVRRSLETDQNGWDQLAKRLSGYCGKDWRGEDEDGDTGQAYLLITGGMVAIAVGAMAAGVVVGKAARDAWDNITDDEDNDSEESGRTERSESRLLSPVGRAGVIWDPIIIILLPWPISLPEPDDDDDQDSESYPTGSRGVHLVEMLKRIDARPDYSRLMRMYGPSLCRAFISDRQSGRALQSMLSDSGVISIDQGGGGTDGETDTAEAIFTTGALVVGGAFLVGAAIGWLSADDEDEEDESEEED